MNFDRVALLAAVTAKIKEIEDLIDQADRTGIKLDPSERRVFEDALYRIRGVAWRLVTTIGEEGRFGNVAIK